MKRLNFFAGFVALTLTACGKITNTNSDFEIDSGGMVLNVSSSPSTPKSIQIRDSMGNLVGRYAGTESSLYIDTVGSNRLIIFGNDEVTIENASSNIFITGSNNLNLTASSGDLQLNAILGDIKLLSLPTSDPGVPGAIWNDAGTLKIST